MSVIGGFLELEISKSKCEIHENVSKYNLARNAIVDYLLTVKATKVWLPSYCCSSVSKALKDKGINYCFYNINEEMEIVGAVNLRMSDYLLYVNYFGLKSEYTKLLIEEYGDQLVVDNSQAFYASFSRSRASIYSLRKFFGVPDGAYLKPALLGKENYEHNEPAYDVTHLVGRVEKGPESYYKSYKESEIKLAGAGIRPMSLLTESLVSATDHEYVRRARIENYKFLQDQLGGINSINKNLILGCDHSYMADIPLVYPYLHKQGEDLKKELIKNKIFVPSYWQEVIDNPYSSEFERYFTKNMVPLPIDQRYTTKEMEVIVDVIKEFNDE